MCLKCVKFYCLDPPEVERQVDGNVLQFLLDTPKSCFDNHLHSLGLEVVRNAEEFRETVVKAAAADHVRQIVAVTSSTSIPSRGRKRQKTGNNEEDNAIQSEDQ
jgi:hypothetical protein